MVDTDYAAFAYVRDSGGREQEQSTSQQQRAIEAWARDNNIVVVEWYVDAAQPGSSVDKREAFLSMIDAACRKPAPVGAIVTWDFARFSRNELDRTYYTALLARHGVQVVSITQPLPDTPASGIIREALAFSDAEKLRTMSKDIRRGLQAAAALGRTNGKRPPPGYVRTAIEVGRHRDGSPRLVQRWQVDADAAALVREAFRLYVSGASAREIHAALGLAQTDDGYRHLFHNPLYAGRIVLGGFEYHDEALRIVDDATWQAAQVRRQQRIAPRTVVSPFLLSGLLYCGVCGNTLNGQRNRARPNKAHYYRCRRSNTLEPTTCNVLVRCDVVDAAVWQTVTARLDAFAGDFVAELRARAACTSQASRAAKIAADMRRAENAISVLLDLAEGGTVAVADIRQRLRQREQEIITLKEQLAAIPPADAQPFDEDRVRARLAELRAAMDSVDVGARRRALTALLERVTYHPTAGVTLLYRSSV